MPIVPVSFVFDDGFTDSCLKVADMFEARGLSATFAVLVNHDGFMPDFPKGDFALWQQLLERGHEIHPHGWDHSDLSKLPFEEAAQQIDGCLAHFAEHLDGFTAANAVYHLTYNRSTPEVDRYLLQRVRAIRTTGPQGIPTNGLNNQGDLKRRRFDCAWEGPLVCDEHLLTHLQGATSASDAAHFCYMLHGLDLEGWGPVSSLGLMRALDTIIESPDLAYEPIGAFACEHCGEPTE